MKTLLRKWRGLHIAAALAAAVLPLHGAQVKTLGGGPNQSGISRYGSANGNTLLNAKFFNPYGVVQDQNGNLFIADRSNNKVRKITKPGAADSFTSTFKSSLLSPVGVAVDGSNNVYVLTQGDGKLRKYSNTGLLLKTVSRLASPTALAVSTNYTVYVVELGGSLKKLLPTGGGFTNFGPGGFNQPRGIAILPDGRLAISASQNHAIYLVDPTNGVATLLAGGNGAGFNDGPGGLALFNGPYGIAAAPNGALFVADRNNNRMRKVTTDGNVSTIFGMDRSLWPTSFAGWVDGDTSVAVARAPVGVTVGQDGTVYDTEVYWHLIREVTGLDLAATGPGSGVSTNVVGTNTFVGTNIISFGFPSGEGSSAFIGAAGQSFYAPVTLALAPGQAMYSLQFGITATNDTGTGLDATAARFESMLLQPGGISITYNILTGEWSTNVVYIPIDQNYQFRDDAANLLGVGWIERYPHTNLYNTVLHHLVKYSSTKDHLYDSDVVNKAIVGAYRVIVPLTAADGDTFRIKLSNASATPKDWTENVPLRMPTDGSLGAGAMNTIKRITVGSAQYIVGDTVPFRWYNAGDFGEGTLLNNDVIQIFESAVYNENYPILDSDLFDALDSSDGTSTNALFLDNDLTIDTKTVGDGILAVDDVFVTFRRSLDPTLKWFARYWSNGVRNVIEVPNALSTFGFDAAPKSLLVQKSAVAPAVRPSVALSLNDAMATPNQTLQFPVHADVLGGYPLRVMMLSLTVEALDGSPVLTTPIQFQTVPGFHAPELSRSRGAAHYSAAWLTNHVVGFSGSGTLALLNVSIPAGAGSGAAYRVHFNHFSGSPNGTDLFATHTSDALILLSDRSGSTWGDGISDAWRLRYFGSIFSSDSAAAGDPDGDGVINSIEAANGTDPTDPLSN